MKIKKQISNRIGWVYPKKTPSALTIFFLIIVIFTATCNILLSNNVEKKHISIIQINSKDTSILVFDVVEEMPLFNGATNEQQSREYWKEEVYKESKKLNIKNTTGKKAFISFVVFNDGHIDEIKIMVSSGDTTVDEFAIHCGKTLGTWSIGKQKGQPVNVRVIMSVHVP